MQPQEAIPTSAISRWQESSRLLSTPPIVVAFDFDGTLTPRYSQDSLHFEHIAQHGAKLLSSVLDHPGIIGSVCTSRSLLEVKRILDAGFQSRAGQALHGVSVGENGAVAFCAKLPAASEARLMEAGFRIDSRYSDLTIIDLSRVSIDTLKNSIILPAAKRCRMNDEEWSSSVLIDPDDYWSPVQMPFQPELPPNFRRLFEMSRHSDPMETRDACVRWGSAYVKVNECARAKEFIETIADFAEKHSVHCLVTPPMDGSPIWTADLGGGVTKFEGLASVSLIISILCELPEQDFGMIFFGDGENDLPGFEYVTQRTGSHNMGFLVDSPVGNSSRAARTATGTFFLQNLCDLSGVAEGMKQARNALRFKAWSAS